MGTQRTSVRGASVAPKARQSPAARATGRRNAVVASAAKKSAKKVVLAYSGGLDTSIILKWIQDEYNCEVVTFTADLGQVQPMPAPPWFLAPFPALNLP